MPDPLSLPEAADLIYRALLRRPGLTTAQLAADLGRSAGQIAETLESLAAAGLVAPTAAAASAPPTGPSRNGRPTRGDPVAGYRALAPDLGFSRLLDQRERDLRRGRAQLGRLMEAFRESSADGRPGGPDGLVELISGPEAIDARIRQLFDSARSQIRAFDRPPYLQTPGTNLDYESHRLREGITYRVLYSRDALVWPGRYRADIAAGCAAGEQARVRATLPTKLMLADNHLALLPVVCPDTSADLAYAIRAPALLAALGALFEGEWERAVPLGAAAVGDEPDETGRTLLQLLAAGLTDTAIARELDWSPRTTQRRMKELFDRLGVATRFQAGVAARDRGWLRPGGEEA